MMAEGAGAPGRLDVLLPGHDDLNFPLLRFVDSYGDTVFNGMQCRALLEEIASLAKGARSEADHLVLDQLSEMAGVVADGVHLYLRCVGD